MTEIPALFVATRQTGEWNVKAPDGSWVFALGFQNQATAIRVAGGLNLAHRMGYESASEPGSTLNVVV